ncbi:hypothetical protein HGM15179_015199 [Zosterops borbonicus]|uniref:Envelope glycoprotein n=1 Tax=Zosterops borbonicus TaxID=364589 RepID=A0A8K1G5K4_9PASS|nr:hypothetical protein HGM15179_015199 [Zosterops borbonicus]
MGQDHICLSQGSAQDPIASCLVGIPFKEDEFPPTLLSLVREFNAQMPVQGLNAPMPRRPPWWKSPLFLGDRSPEGPRRQKRVVLPVVNPLIVWKDWVSSSSLSRAPSEPQELELLGSSPAPYCVHFKFTPPKGREKSYINLLQIKSAYMANQWCREIAHVETPSTSKNFPLSLPTGTFLICGDRAFTGIPSRLIGGPCTLGRLGLFAPNKTQITDWILRNSSLHAPVQKRSLAELDPDCESDVIHWSRAKATAIMVFLPWISVAKAMGELGRLEYWVAKQANLTSAALSNLLADEEVTRQATLQNRAAIDYLLLLHHHTCEEFEGLCCFNLTSKAEDVRKSIRKMQDMVHELKRETKDWWDNLFGDWGLKGWANSAIKTGLLILFILFIVGIAFGIIRRLTTRLITNATSSLSVNNVWATTPPLEEIEMQTFAFEERRALEDADPEDFLPEAEGQWPPAFEDWPTNQQWFGDLYPNSEYLAPQPQFHPC